MIGELVAINGYAEHIANSEMAEINAAWEAIIRDEKRHYGILLGLLRRYDPDEYAQYRAHRDEKNGPKEVLQAYRPDCDRQIILNNIRQDIKGELEAVILYEQEFADIPYEDIRKALYEIIVDEKGHAEHLTQLMLKYDRDKYDSLD